MALTKLEKDSVVAEVVALLSASKLTVVAKYEGTTVKALQGLRRELAGKYNLLLSDIKPIKALAAGEKSARGDVAKMSDMLRITKGVDAIVHLGGYSVNRCAGCLAVGVQRKPAGDFKVF